MVKQSANVRIIGNLGKAPVIRVGSVSRKEFGTFSVAVTTQSKKLDDMGRASWEDDPTSWFEIAVFGEFVVNRVVKNLTKGCSVMIDGRISLETYEGKQRVKITVGGTGTNIEEIKKQPKQDEADGWGVLSKQEFNSKNDAAVAAEADEIPF